jgi:hypothetical protein
VDIGRFFGFHPNQRIQAVFKSTKNSCDNAEMAAVTLPLLFTSLHKTDYEARWHT